MESEWGIARLSFAELLPPGGTQPQLLTSIASAADSMFSSRCLITLSPMLRAEVGDRFASELLGHQACPSCTVVLLNSPIHSAQLHSCSASDKESKEVRHWLDVDNRFGGDAPTF